MSQFPSTLREIFKVIRVRLYDFHNVGQLNLSYVFGMIDFQAQRDGIFAENQFRSS